MPLQLRGYQQRCLERALAVNTIVVLPTNMGKTLIAVRAMDHFLATSLSKCAVLVVPTKALVRQQAEYCVAHCDGRPRVRQLCGNEMDGWDKLQWDAALRQFRILVGTPEVFRQAMAKGYLSPGRISLLVFDECHNAVGRSPMARIMSEGIAGCAEAPRILGLTASFISGALKRKRDAESSKIELELLLGATVMCPRVDGEEGAIGGAGADRSFERVVFPDAPLDERFLEAAESFLTELVAKMDPQRRVASLPKIVGRMKHVLVELGLAGFTHGLRYNLLHQLESRMQDLAQLSGANVGARAEARVLREELPKMEATLEHYKKPGSLDADLQAAPARSKKVQVLFGLMQRRLMAMGKGIIFVNQVIVTVPLAHMLQQHVPGVQALGCHGGMLLADQQRKLADFRDGLIQVLVSTEVLLEGIDVPDCKWIVRFDAFGTTKSHIQGSGRARSTTAQIFYFENAPETEHARAQLMTSVAHDSHVLATPQLRQEYAERQDAYRQQSKGIHPFEMPGFRPVDFSNGLEIVYGWCQRILGSGFEAAGICNWSSVEEGARLLEIRMPGPDGDEVVTCDDVVKYWGSLQLEDAIPPDVLRGYSRKDKELRKALFVAAVRLRKLDCLDEANEPRALHLKRAKLKRGRVQGTLRVNIGKSYPRDDPMVRSENYISALNEWAQRKWPNAGGKNLIEYTYTQGADGWTASVKITRGGEDFRGVACAQKKAAQQSAAKLAYERLVS